VGEFFETEDIGLAEHLLSGVYGAVQISPHGQRRGIRLTRTSLTSAAHLDQVSFAMSLDIAAAPIGVLIFNDLKSGRVRHGSDREDRSYGSGQVYLAGQPEHPRTATIQDAVAELAVIDPALVTQLADTTQGRAPRPVRFTSYEPVSPQAAAQWRVTYAYVRDTVLASPDAAAEPLVAAGVARLLVATALAAFPNNALTDPTIEDRHDAHPATLRRAVAFIDENAHLDVTVADVAAAASVTIRAVQLAFQRHMGISPMEYLRRVRLDHARQDLMRAGPGGGLTVTAVAYRWGFRSSSRFAAAYRRAYGVSPSHTLNRD
jgi:AraC-like DNA-binding protein